MRERRALSAKDNNSKNKEYDERKFVVLVEILAILFVHDIETSTAHTHIELQHNIDQQENRQEDVFVFSGLDIQMN